MGFRKPPKQVFITFLYRAQNFAGKKSVLLIFYSWNWSYYMPFILYLYSVNIILHFNYLSLTAWSFCCLSISQSAFWDKKFYWICSVNQKLAIIIKSFTLPLELGGVCLPIARSPFKYLLLVSLTKCLWYTHLNRLLNPKLKPNYCSNCFNLISISALIT